MPTLGPTGPSPRTARILRIPDLSWLAAPRPHKNGIFRPERTFPLVARGLGTGRFRVGADFQFQSWERERWPKVDSKVRQAQRSHA
jgi:hypothetical protein